MAGKDVRAQQEFTRAQAAELARVAYPTIGFLQARGILSPSVRSGGARGAASLYSFEDVVALRSVVELRQSIERLEGLARVAQFWQSAAGRRAVAEALSGAARRVLVVSPDGTPALESEASLPTLFSKFNASVLHVIDVRALVGQLFVDVTSEHMLQRLPLPGPTGRIPRLSSGKESRELARREKKNNRGRTSR